jgi:hypothetical protein
VSAAGWAIVISALALGVSIYEVVRGEMRAHESRKQRVAIGPAADDARKAIEDAREAFQEMVTLGGRDNRFFLNEWKGVERALQDNAGRVGDEMRPLIEAIITTWRQAFGYAPPGHVVIDLNNIDNDPERAARFDRQVAAAERGLEQCEAALRRLNELESGR